MVQISPITELQLVDRLLAEAAGRVVLWNVLDCYNDGLFSRGDLQLFFYWWRAALPFIEATPSPLREADPLFATLELLLLEPEQWATLHSKYAGLSSLGTKPELRVLCRRRAGQRRKGRRFATALDAEGFFTHLAADVKNQLLGTAVLDTVGEGVRAKATFGGMPHTARVDHLKDGAHLGPPGGVLWFTLAEAIQDPLDQGSADDLRDLLGLVHVGEDVDLMVVEFESTGLRPSVCGRPTAFDAGSHRRFKAQADKATNRRRSSWGHTADLNRIARGMADVDGAPERVSHPVPAQALGNVVVHAVGRTSVKRGGDRRDDDRFLDLLERGRDAKTLKQVILSLL